MSNKVQKPFGRVAKRITIEADDNGTIRVIAVDIPLIAPAGAKMLPLDSREMVLALMKVSMDYTSALFENLKLEGKHETTKTGDDPNGSTHGPN